MREIYATLFRKILKRRIAQSGSLSISDLLGSQFPKILFM